MAPNTQDLLETKNTANDRGADVDGSSATFRFLDLPKELRLMVYERLPRTVKHTTISLPAHTFYSDQPSPCNDKDMIFVTNSTSTAVLATCKFVHDEALVIVKTCINEWVVEGGFKIIAPLNYLLSYSSQDALKLILSLVFEKRNVDDLPRLDDEYWRSAISAISAIIENPYFEEDNEDGLVDYVCLDYVREIGDITWREVKKLGQAKKLRLNIVFSCRVPKAWNLMSERDSENLVDETVDFVRRLEDFRDDPGMTVRVLGYSPEGFELCNAAPWVPNIQVKNGDEDDIFVKDNA